MVIVEGVFCRVKHTAGGRMATPESESFVRTFARGLKIIEAMGQGAVRQTLGDVAEAVDLPRTAVRRFLLTLIGRKSVAGGESGGGGGCRSRCGLVVGVSS